jgi:hypothetical protein
MPSGIPHLCIIPSRYQKVIMHPQKVYFMLGGFKPLSWERPLDSRCCEWQTLVYQHRPPLWLGNIYPYENGILMSRSLRDLAQPRAWTEKFLQTCCTLHPAIAAELPLRINKFILVVPNHFLPRSRISPLCSLAPLSLLCMALISESSSPLGTGLKR